MSKTKKEKHKKKTVLAHLVGRHKRIVHHPGGVLHHLVHPLAVTQRFVPVDVASTKKQHT